MDTVCGMKTGTAPQPLTLLGLFYRPPPPPPQAPTSQGLPGNVDPAVATWAFAQAAASLAPAITQLAQANIQQRQQMNSFQQTAQAQTSPKPQAPPPQDPMKELSARLQETRDSNALRQALQAAMAEKGLAPAPPPPQASPAPQGLQSMVAAQQLQQQQQQLQQLHQQQQKQQQQALKRKDSPSVLAPKMSVAPRPAGGNGEAPARPRTDEDKQAGNILLGFLSSLRQSYEEALKEKGHGSSTSTPRTPATSLQDAVNRMNPQRPVPQVSDISSGISSSTGQPESSVEESDWNSDKKTETSSSEESDKEVTKGPPRKRLKTKRAADDRRRDSVTAWQR